MAREETKDVGAQHFITVCLGLKIAGIDRKIVGKVYPGTIKMLLIPPKALGGRKGAGAN